MRRMLLISAVPVAAGIAATAAVLASGRLQMHLRPPKERFRLGRFAVVDLGG